MTTERDGILASAVRSQEQGAEIMGKLVNAAPAGAVFSQPVTSGEYTIITASEVSVAMGFGFGLGGGTRPTPAQGNGTAEAGDHAQEGAGGGGGGGGVSSGRPVAAISVGPDGVQVEPIIDPTKIGLAFITIIGAVFLMLIRMRRSGRR